MADYVAGYTQKMDDSDSHSPDSLVVEMGESLRMVEARRRKKNTAQRSVGNDDGWMVQETTNKDPENVSPLQISSEASPGNSKDLAAITKSLPTTFLSYGKVIAIKMGKNMKDLLGCLGLDDEDDVVDPRTVRKIAKQHHRSHGHQQSTSKDKDPRQPFSFPPCPALPSDQPWVDDLLVANKDALWIIFYHFSDNNQSESYITVPKLQEFLSVETICPMIAPPPPLLSLPTSHFITNSHIGTLLHTPFSFLVLPDMWRISSIGHLPRSLYHIGRRSWGENTIGH